VSHVVEETVCYRHPSRETGVSCSRCGRPICTECMTSTPVGMRCPECSGEKTKVVSMRSLNTPTTTVTIALIAVNVLLFVASGQFGIGSGGGGSRLDLNLGLFGPYIDQNHEYYRLVTSGFLHTGLIHIGFNMYLLWILGQMLEGPLGSKRFAGLYAASLLAGSFGALLFEPRSLTIGASGAVFGLMGAAFFQMRARGMSPMAGGIGPLILFNLVFSFAVPNVSIGGHIGGLLGGSLCTLGLVELEKHRQPAWMGYLVLLAVGVVSVVGAIAVSGDASGLGV
jgi:membrane associated rhomboid family serine protease